ncbi:Phosphatidylinositolglycan class N-domain-containing protein [Rhodocollybia butyracea]|uniref:GPI ethanolamine phosphate transferase 1 n=1 Tax=Rhodocollybia butyracea TaxID=206335 RepID=A0A9P5UH42_9AGAR|nr:Phosphatidylinositolglycan class N-domain-containing protein [Rhodocollybia butyracea]
MQAFNTSRGGNGLSKRVVLISADGLRADLLFEPNGFLNALSSNDTEGVDIVAPYLRSIISSRGAFGVSHTRVPTESRPGHVALIAGMYEDVSAVTKGWKVNPVEFDSVFNRSTGTWAFGSPDIVPMFTQGSQGRVREWCYDESEEDFTKDATALDIWVLDQLRRLLQDSNSAGLLRRRGTVFFLHLLGLDTTGHSYRPFSREYMHNIQVVDSIVRQVEELLDDFYEHDGETSFVFTADHGMSVIGNHGDGHPDNTRTPYVVWGKGIRGPLIDSDPTLSSHDAYSQGWDLWSSSNELLYRRDIEQADLAPLMTTLLGTDWPVNSVGVVPVDLLDPSGLSMKEGDVKERSFKTQVMLVNAKVILEQYRVKHDLKHSHKLFYTPFPPLAGDQYPQELERIEELISDVDRNILAYDEARRRSMHLITTGLAGLHYLQTYERTVIRSMVTAAYTGWAAWAGCWVFFRSTLSATSTTGAMLVHIISAAALLAMGGMFWLEQSPWTYYLYLTFPVFFWDRVLSSFVTADITLYSVDLMTLNKRRIIGNALLVGSSLVGMVLGYTHRSLWSAGFVIIGVVWPATRWKSETQKALGHKCWMWTLSCLVTAMFPLLEVNKEESLVNIIFGGLSALAVGGMILRYIYILIPPQSSKNTLVLFGVQTLLILSMLFVTCISTLSLQAKHGLPVWCQIVGWALFALSLFVAFIPGLPVESSSPAAKYVLYLRYLLGITPLFIILSLSDETLFFVSYALVMGLWVVVEEAIGKQRSKSSKSSAENLSTYHFQADDLRIVLFFLFFVQTAFFGTGNVASVSSFYLSPVYRLIPVFNPFFMSGLLICKIIAPYVMLAISTAAVTHTLGLPPFSLFLVALTVTDGMTLMFFFNVTDTGSWLEIGQTISFFVIASLLTLWSGGVCIVGELLMESVLRGSVENAKKKQK